MQEKRREGIISCVVEQRIKLAIGPQKTCRFVTTQIRCSISTPIDTQYKLEQFVQLDFTQQEEEERARLSTSKSKLEPLDAQLQVLQYEKDSYLSEIEQCRQYGYFICFFSIFIYLLFVDLQLIN
jgi:cell fate regulator YaaT (PSP1 superfamily)